MKKQYKVEGMTCDHCVAHVKSALEEMDGIKKAKVQLKSPQATLEFDNEPSLDQLKKAVASAGDYSLSALDASEQKKGIFSKLKL